MGTTHTALIISFLLGNGEESRLRRGDLEMVARRAFSLADLPDDCPDPAEVAVALGYRIFRLPRGALCSPELCVAGRIYYAAHRDPLEVAARIAHGLAHSLLLADGCDHGEPDVWRLTAELLAPYWLVRGKSRARAKTLAPHCPDWILATRPTLEATG